MTVLAVLQRLRQRPRARGGQADAAGHQRRRHAVRHRPADPEGAPSCDLNARPQLLAAAAHPARCPPWRSQPNWLSAAQPMLSAAMAKSGSVAPSGCSAAIRLLINPTGDRTMHAGQARSVPAAQPSMPTVCAAVGAGRGSLVLDGRERPLLACCSDTAWSPVD